ncbi:MAG: Peptide chain release factor 2 [Chlamydiae bacterium]|nr:Peptide chain release factor 2 [Chlamydiota bacterium]
MEAPDFWEDNTQAQEIIAESNELKGWITPYNELKSRFEGVETLLPEASEMGDEALVDELVVELDKVEKELSTLEVRRMLSGEMDNKNCYLSINAGAGGTEACDWVSMLSRMYERWADRRGWKIEVVDSVEGDVAGIKSITFKLTGDHAYGYAKAEKGVHRLVRISPFDSGARRHTSFASVDATPEITDDIIIEITPSEIRIDTFRASGAGGQHVNVTDSAVRITHIATGIVVTCQNERSQTQNKETCLKLLRSKLYEKQIMERKESMQAMEGEKKEIAWGSQIRNYVFQPYTLVKDTRTGHEAGNIGAVMDGELLDDFIIAYLKEFG